MQCRVASHAHNNQADAMLRHVLKYDLETTFGISPLVITRKSIQDILVHYTVTLALAVVSSSDQYLVAEHTSKTAE